MGTFVVGAGGDLIGHARPDGQERDALVEKVFEAAGLPLVRFPAQRAYALAEVAGRRSVVFGDGIIGERPPMNQPAVSAVAAGQGAAGNVVQEATGISAPLCPKCGIALVIRSGPRGNFFGCSNFPKCRETAQVG